MKVIITKGRDKGKKGTVIKYMGDELYRILTEDDHRTVIHVSEFKKVEGN